MLESSTVRPGSGELVLFGAGLFDENGAPRHSRHAALATAQSKKRRARRAAKKRSDGFTKRAGRLTDLAALLSPSEAQA